MIDNITKQVKYKESLDLWFPNLFEYKGGIQVYLQDILQAIQEKSPKLSVHILDKLDRHRPIDKWQTENFSFSFSGNIPKSWQTLHFAIHSIRSALINKPKLIVCGHLNFAPVALWLNRLLGIPYWILVYGVDAWNIKDLWKIEALKKAEKIISIFFLNK